MAAVLCSVCSACICGPWAACRATRALQYLQPAVPAHAAMQAVWFRLTWASCAYCTLRAGLPVTLAPLIPYIVSVVILRAGCSSLPGRASCACCTPQCRATSHPCTTYPLLCLTCYAAACRLFEFAWKGQLRVLYPTEQGYQSPLHLFDSICIVSAPMLLSAGCLSLPGRASCACCTPQCRATSPCLLTWQPTQAC
jgi:hypothetical protein